MPRKKKEEEQKNVDSTPKKRTTRLFQSTASEPESKPKKRVERSKAEEKPAPKKTSASKPEEAPKAEKKKAAPRKRAPKKTEETPVEDVPKFTLRKSASKKPKKKEDEPKKEKPLFSLLRGRRKKVVEEPAEEKPTFTLRKSENKKADEEKPKRKPASRSAKPKLEAPQIEVPEGAEDILKHLSWRPKQESTPEKENRRDTTKSNTRQDSRSRKKPVSANEEPKEDKPKRAPRKAAEPKPEVVKPKREHIPIPEEAAQVIVHEGIPSIVHKKQIIPPISFCAKIDDSRLETVLEECRLAADNGIHLYTLKYELLVEDSGAKNAFKEVEAQSKKLLDVDPEAKIIARLNITPPTDWDKKFNNAKYKTDDGKLAKPSVCDDEFWSVAEDCLINFAKSVRKNESVIGIHIDYGEWFVRDDEAHDTSEAALTKFRDWLKRRYREDDVSLRAAWFDGTVTLNDARIPDLSSEKAKDGFVRTGRAGRRWVDYNLFVSDSTVARMAKLSYSVKKASEGWLLVGVSYGYTFEWSHPANGHLSLGKLLRCPDIDYIAGPPSYKSREPGSSAPFPGPIDSFALNGKLYLSEDDFKTPISGPGTEPDRFNPAMTTPQALESAHWRSAGAALAHRSGAVWTDSWGNGWLNSRGIWERAANVQRTMAQRYATEHGDTDVAILIDERSLAYLVDEEAFDALVQNVRESVLRSGLSASFYLLSDLAHRENFPEAKLYVFLNAWDMRAEVRSAIKTRLQKDNKVLFWLYSAGLFEAGRGALERVREVTGIALKPQPFHSKTGTALLDMRHPLCAPLPADKIAEGGHLTPSYFAIPEESTVLGEYTHSGLPSFVVREYTADEESEHSWTSVFLGEPVVSPGLFRALGQMAGAHVWNFDDDVMHCRRPFLTAHCRGAGQRTLTLPQNWEAYDLINSSWAHIEGTSLRFNAIDGATHVFLTGIKSDIQAMLDADTDALLKIDKLDPRVENTVHWDDVQFDVEIMKLDEWMDETWSEELADDLLIKPSMIDDVDPEDDEEPPVPKSRGNRRRGQGRRGGRSQRHQSDRARKENANKEYDESGIGVLFRKSK